MLVLTNGLVWISPFSAWLIWIPAGMFVAFLLLEIFLNKSGKWGVFGKLSLMSIVVSLLIGGAYMVMGSPPHYDILQKDISSQAMIKEFQWSDFPRFVGKNPEGEFVKCTYFATEISNVVQIVCDK